MPTFNTQLLHGQWALRVLTALACASQAALVAITVTLATENDHSGRLIDRIALAASFVGILTLPALITVLFLHQRRARRRTLVAIEIGSLMLSISAAALTMYALLMWWRNTRGDDHKQSLCALIIAGYAVWAGNSLLQAMLYTLALLSKQGQSAVLSMEEATRASLSRLAKRSTSTQSSHLVAPTSTPTSEPEPLSSAFSAYSTSPRSSMIVKVIRPVTSRTKLLFHNSFASPESNSCSASELSVKSGETERCGPIKHKKSLPKKFLTSQLETIPGSRSASPVNALHGPFSGHWNTPIESPMPQPSSPTGSFAVAVSRTPSRQRRDPDQSYIHPLFRSESPTPPPIASPGTVITASPHAGQVVSPEHRPFSPCRWHSGGEPQA